MIGSIIKGSQSCHVVRGFGCGAMDFLRESLLLSPKSKRPFSKTCCFAADLFSGRPSCEQIASWQECARELTDAFNKLLARKASPIAWMACFIAVEGAILLVCAKSDMQVNSMRSALGTAIAPLPKEHQKTILETLRPLDELDTHRIDAWETLASLRPKWGRERPAGIRDRSDHSDRTVKRARTLAELREPSTDSESEGSNAHQLVGVGFLALTDGSPQPELDLFDPMRVWAHRAKTEATVVIVYVGQRPHDLDYISCHREPRRALFLRRMVQKN